MCLAGVHLSLNSVKTLQMWIHTPVLRARTFRGICARCSRSVGERDLQGSLIYRCACVCVRFKHARQVRRTPFTESSGRLQEQDMLAKNVCATASGMNHERLLINTDVSMLYHRMNNRYTHTLHSVRGFVCVCVCLIM